MKLLWDPTKERFILACEYKEADFARDAGLVWDKRDRVWWTREPILIAGLRGTPDLTTTPETVEALRKAEAIAQSNIEKSRAITTSYDVPKPEGIDKLTGKPFEYLPFQRAGIYYAMNRKDTLFGDQMGIGKTIQAIGVVNADDLAHRVLIVCPAFLKDNWLKEFTKWDVKHLSVGVIRTGRTKTKYLMVDKVKTKIVEDVLFPTEDVVITSYELLDDWRDEVRSIKWDVLIVDECHYLKNKKAARTRELFGCRKDGEQEHIDPVEARRRLFLSGTPFLNAPYELWPLLSSIDPEGLGRNRFFFEKKYCDGHHELIVPQCKQLTFAGRVAALSQVKEGEEDLYQKVWVAKGSSNAPELQARIRSNFMVRRLREDVFPARAKKQRQILLIDTDAPGFSTLLKEEKKTYEEYGRDLLDVDLDTPEFSKISSVRREIGIKKIPFIVDRVKEVLSETEKVVVFVHHHEVIDGLRIAFPDAVIVDGRVSNDERQALVDRFQEDKDTRIFIGTIGAAGIGFTLTAAWVAVFGELDWKPSTISQAEDRLDRMGQTKGVLIQHIVLAGSLDERQVQLIIQKQEVADANLDTEVA